MSSFRDGGTIQATLWKPKVIRTETGRRSEHLGDGDYDDRNI